MAMQFSTTPGARGICPQGWHIPTHDEYTTLERAVCTSGTCATDFPYDTTTFGWRGTTEGTKLKPNGTSGFEGNLAGFGYSGSFNGRGSGGLFWSSSESGGSAWYRYLDSAEARVFRGTDFKAYGFSVRCLRDSDRTPSVTINQTLPNPTLDSGLVGHWTFDGPNVDWSSTTAEIRDTSPYHNNGDAQGGINQQSVAQGVLGQGIRFNGIGNYISIGNASVQGNSQTSISLWFMPRKLNNTVQILHNETINADANSRVSVRIYSDNTLLLRARIPDSAGAVNVVKSTLPLRVATWYHVVAVINASSSVQWLYINGVGESNTASVGAFDATAPYQPATLGIDGVGAQLFDGVLDDVRIYNRALSAAEVKRLYQLGLGVTVDGFVCGKSRVQDRDLNWYDTVQVGTQCWMRQNMRVGTRISGATNQTSTTTIQKWCYNDLDSNCTGNNPNQPDGGLYQWNMAMQFSTTPGARGICPVGFHIPTDAEQYTLENYLKDNGQTCNASRSGYDCSTAGTKLKPNGTSGWEGNPAGFATPGSFSGRGNYGYFWSSSESGGNAWNRFLYSTEARVGRGTNDKAYGFSVRCLRD